MENIKGYRVRMWTSAEATKAEKFFHAGKLIDARRAAFAYADSMVDVMEEAKQAGVINYNDPEEILHPDVRLEDVVIGSVHVTVVYETITNDITMEEEDLIYMPVPNEGSKVEVPVGEDEIVQYINLETIDLNDEETIRIHNREVACYIKEGAHEGIIFLTIGEKELFLLMDDYERLKSKSMILVEEIQSNLEEKEP